jgi:PAS domain S-box-containing protein
MLLRIQRHGSDWDDARFTLGYSPVDDPTAPTGIGGVLVTAVEITDRVAAEDALKASEAALRDSRGYMADILRSSGEAFYAVDREGATTLCNQAFLRVLGFASEEDAIGRKLHDVIHHTHPDGSTYEKTDCPIYICAATAEPAHVQDEYFYRLDGERFPAEYWVSRNSLSARLSSAPFPRPCRTTSGRRRQTVSSTGSMTGCTNTAARAPALWTERAGSIWSTPTMWTPPPPAGARP